MIPEILKDPELLEYRRVNGNHKTSQKYPVSKSTLYKYLGKEHKDFLKTRIHSPKKHTLTEDKRQEYYELGSGVFCKNNGVSRRLVVSVYGPIPKEYINAKRSENAKKKGKAPEKIEKIEKMETNHKKAKEHKIKIEGELVEYGRPASFIKFNTNSLI